jgi:hypothetical protein
MDKNKIKVVKRGSMPAVTVKKKKKVVKRNSAREMVTTVSDWVADVRERKTLETRAAIDFLLGASQRPHES